LLVAKDSQAFRAVSTCRGVRQILKAACKTDCAAGRRTGRRKGMMVPMKIGFEACRKIVKQKIRRHGKI
jgi:hypothetical protein